MIHTTLNRIREHSPCEEGWAKLLRHLGKTQADDEPFPFVTVLDSNGLDDALWCLRAEPQHAALWRLYAVGCLRGAQRQMAAAECYVHGPASDEAPTVAAWARTAVLDAAAWAAASGAVRAAQIGDLRALLTQHDAAPGEIAQ